MVVKKILKIFAKEYFTRTNWDVFYPTVDFIKGLLMMIVGGQWG